MICDMCKQPIATEERYIVIGDADDIRHAGSEGDIWTVCQPCATKAQNFLRDCREGTR